MQFLIDKHIWYTIYTRNPCKYRIRKVAADPVFYISFGYSASAWARESCSCQ